MASNPPGKCCTELNLHSGEVKGTYKELFGLPVYQVGEQYDNIIVIATDIFGYHLKNTALVADALAEVGKFHVLIPDILGGDPFTKDLSELHTWSPHHGREVTFGYFNPFINKVKSELSPKFLGAIGYCFGAQYVVCNLGKDSILDAGAVAHPSSVSIEEVKAITKPLMINAAEVDPAFPIESRYETEKILAKASAEKGLVFQINLYSGVFHGFAVRGDLSDPSVKYARERAIHDQAAFFGRFSS